MPPVASTMLPLGTKAPDFDLPDPRGGRFRRWDYEGMPLLVMFLCNHCPFVIHVKDELRRIAEEYVPRGVAIVGICSNDAEAYPADAPEEMAKKAEEWRWRFPYLHDADQTVARAYRAACTPDFFLFDREHKLVYRGQLDDSRPNNGLPVTGSDLRKAIEAVLLDESPPVDQKPSLGCSIKWKQGCAPDYASASS